jgi:hypothetical protein
MDKYGMIMKAKLIAITCLPLALVACGGGGGGGSSPNTSTPITLTAKINGVPVASFSVSSGESKVLGITTGQEVEFDSVQASTLVQEPSFGGAQATISARTPNQFKASVTAVNHAIGKLVFASQASPTLPPATVTLSIRGSSTTFGPVKPVVGDAFTYSENDIQVDAKPVKFDNITHAVTTVNADGSWVENYRKPDSSVIQTVQLNASGNRTSYRDATAAASGGCVTATFTPEEKLLSFSPLLQESGAPWTGEWDTVCSDSTKVIGSQHESFTATPGKFETITTQAGVFNALRIDTKTVVTNSTDVNLPGRTYSQTVTEWFDPVLGRNIRYQGKRTYVSTPALNTFLTDVNIDLVSAVKN